VWIHPCSHAPTWVCSWFVRADVCSHSSLCYCFMQLSLLSFLKLADGISVCPKCCASVLELLRFQALFATGLMAVCYRCC
jgi:hypothetical protein